MQLLESFVNIIVAVTSLGMVVAAVIALAVSFTAWSLMPLGSPRGEAAAATFVVVFGVALLVWHHFENARGGNKP